MAPFLCSNQKYFELFRKFQECQVTYNWHTASFQGRNNYCKTDPDATFMHMENDHMRNAQLKPGYNIQIGVDSEYIVATDVFSDRNDVWTLIPFLKTMDEKLGFRYPSVTADSGYESEEDYTYLRETGQTPYIKPKPTKSEKPPQALRAKSIHQVLPMLSECASKKVFTSVL